MTVELSAVAKALAAADLVADAEVLEVTSIPDTETFARRLARVRLTRVIIDRHQQSAVDYGSLPGQEITIESPGGEQGDLGVFLTGYPRLYKGRLYQLHLAKLGNGNYRVVGWESGVKPLGQSRVFTRNRVDGSNGDGTGAFLYWEDRAMPIPYFISAATFKGYPNFVDAIDASFRTWGGIQNTKIDFLPIGCTEKSINENDGINSVILLRSGWIFDASAIAVTRNFYVAGSGASSGLILDSDILLNAQHHAFTTTSETGRHDVQNILTHEIGHFIGLGHEISPGDAEATMYAVASVNETKKRSLESNDQQGIYSGYAGVTNKQPVSSLPSCAVAALDGGSCLAVHRERTSWPQASIWGLGLLLMLGFAHWARWYVA